MHVNVTRVSSTPTLDILIIAVFALLVFPLGSSAQLGPVDGGTVTPIPGVGHDYVKDLVDTVSPADGSLSIRLKAPVPRGRGIAVPFSFNYDSNGVIQPETDATSGLATWSANSYFMTSGGWNYGIPQLFFTSGTRTTPKPGGIGQYVCIYYTNYAFQDAAGARHSILAGTVSGDGTQDCTAVGLGTVNGGADSQLQESQAQNVGPLYLGDASGTTYFFNPSQWINCGTGRGFLALPSSIEDRNGNYVTFSGGPPSSCNTSFSIADTLGRAVISSSGFGASNNNVTISGLQNPYTLTWGTAAANTFIQNHFLGTDTGCSGFVKDTQSFGVISAIKLPNGQSFQFFYDSTYGLLNEVKYPTGAYVLYSWTQNPNSAFIVFPSESSGNPDDCEYQYATMAVAHRSVYDASGTLLLQQDFNYSPTAWNSAGNSWVSKQTTITTTDKVSGQVSKTIYAYTPINAPRPPYDFDFNVPAPQIPLEQSITYQDGNGNTLRTENKTWFDQFELKSDAVTLDSGQASQTTYTYGAGAQVTEKDEYDFGNILSRKTLTIYQGFASPPLFASILDRPCQQIVQDGSGNRVAETDSYYDGSTALCGTAATQTLSGTGSYTGHDETHYGASAAVPRGNLTTQTRLCFVGSTNCANATTTYTYDETGQRLSEVDPCGNTTCSDMTGTGHTTKYLYTDGYTVLSGGQNVSYTPATPTDAFVTSVTDPLGHAENFTYDFNNSQLTATKDANQQSTTYLYNDSFSRPTQINYPDGGQATISYNDAGANPSISTSKLISAGTTLTRVSVMDSLYRSVQTQLTSDPEGTDYTDISYDGQSHVLTRSNPHRSSSIPTDGTTRYSYDALGRTTLASMPDGSAVSTSYIGNQTVVADELGNDRRTYTDGLGRLTRVDEPTPNALPTAATATIAISGTGVQFVVEPAVAATGSVTVGGGNDRTVQFCKPITNCNTEYDAGTTTITVNGHSDSYTYGTPDTDLTVARALANAINSDSAAPVSASVSTNSNVINIATKAPGAASNYSLSTSSATTNTAFFSGTSFPLSASGSTLTGGKDATNLYDTGTVSATVNGCTAMTTYSQNGNNTASAVASALAGALNSACSNTVSASASGNVITLTTLTDGTAANSDLASGSSVSTNGFSSPSFSTTASGFTGGSNTPLTAPLISVYTYNALDDLLTVQQQGGTSDSTQWRNRSFAYDSLSHLTSAANPETGTITYTYDANGNVATKVMPKANQTASSTVTTHLYTYDTLNRLIQEAHLDPTQGTDQYGYDGTVLSGCFRNPPAITSPTNLIGRRSSMCGASPDDSASSFSYDPMGRVLVDSRTNTAPGVVTKTYTVYYTYYADGSLHTLTYPSGDVVTYTVGGAGRVTNVSDGSNTFVAALSGSPMYTPSGLLLNISEGSGIQMTNAYNSRLQPATLQAQTTANTFFSLSYDFHLGKGDNGNVFQIVNNLDPTRNRVFRYDALNRLAQANTTTTSGSNCWGELYTIDPWGDMTNRSGPAGMTGCSTESLSVTASVKNQISGVTYDAAGNVINDGNGNTPTYDSEDRIETVQGYTYSYDADGVRIRKASGTTAGTLYWPDTNRNVLTETDLHANINEEYIFFNGSRIAQIDRPSGTVHYYFSDHLGSHTVVTSAIGTCEHDIEYYPYGRIIGDHCSGGTPQRYLFTGKERDSESSLDNFGARYFQSTLGRWTSPDVINLTEDRLLSPTVTLNKYLYGGNNPLKYVDPDGRDITVFYDQEGNAGHIVMLAYNQSSGDSAVESFGPANHDAQTKAAMLLNIGVPGQEGYNLQNITSADQLRKEYTSITILLNPDETQKAIGIIRTQHNGEYKTYSNNCTTVCSKILRDLKLTPDAPVSPKGFFTELYEKYGNGAWSAARNGYFNNGIDYGRPRPGYDPFTLLLKASHCHIETSRYYVNGVLVDTTSQTVCDPGY